MHAEDRQQVFRNPAVKKLNNHSLAIGIAIGLSEFYENYGINDILCNRKVYQTELFAFVALEKGQLKFINRLVKKL